MALSCGWPKYEPDTIDFGGSGNAGLVAGGGSCGCRTLLQGCDLNTPEGQQTFKANDLLNKTCAGCVATVVETVEELL